MAKALALLLGMGLLLFQSAWAGTKEDRVAFSATLDSLESAVQDGGDTLRVARWKDAISDVIAASTDKTLLLSILTDTLEHKSRNSSQWNHAALVVFADLTAREWQKYPEHSSLSCGYDAWFQLGRCQRFVGKVREAKQALQQALQVSIQSASGYPCKETGLCYFHLGHATSMSGDYYEAMHLYERAAHHYLQAEGPGSMSLTRANLIISGMYVNIGLHAEALKLGREVLAARQVNPEARPRDNSAACINLVSIFHELGQIDSAIAYLNRSRSWLTQGGEKSPMAWRDYFEVGAPVVALQGDLARAMQMADSSMALTLEMGNAGTRDEAKALLRKSQFAMEMGNPDAAADWTGKALSILLMDFHPDSLLPTAMQLDPEEPWIQTALTVRGKAFLEKGRIASGTQQRQLLELALQHLLLACDQVDNLRKSFRSGGARLDLADATYDQYELGIEAAERLHRITGDERYLVTAWEFMERSKAMALLTEINSLMASERALPDSLRDYEQALTDSMVALERREQLAAPSQREHLHAELLQLQERQQSFIRRMELQYPSYYQIKYDVHLQPIDSLRQYLRMQNASMVEFFMGDSSLYIMYVGNDGMNLRRVERGDRWEEDLAYYCQGLSGHRQFEKVTDALAAAYRLDTALLGTTLVDASNLFLVPDGTLWSLPFEALVSKPSRQFAEASWRLQSNSIQYAYSANYLMRLSAMRLKGNRQLLAFAPKFDLPANENRGFGKLTHNVDEARQVAALTGGASRIGQKATEEQFRKDASKYSVLHIASHARMREGSPDSTGIAFHSLTGEDGFLSVPELRTLRLNADLAVLSACETGDGKLVRGEGMMSLARSFTHSGCRSLVMSLWEVDDEATASIMEEFYRQLQQGSDKDEALRQAKLTYLKAGNAHPAKWAAFVGIGSPDPIALEQGGNGMLLWVVLAAIAALVLFAAGWKLGAD